MAFSEEWWEYHFTPDGWVDGSFKLDSGGGKQVPIPENRVLTICETETMGYNYSRIETSWE